MENQSNQALENKSDAVSVIAKVYQGPRQLIYSYLEVAELIKVATLSKRERETVLNSKILKENRQFDGYFCWANRFFDRSDHSDVALQGLLIAIQLSTKLKLSLECKRQDENLFKYVFPAMIAAAVKAGTYLHIYDFGVETLNEFAAKEIEKAGAQFDFLSLKQSVCLWRLIARARSVSLFEMNLKIYKEIKQVIETYKSFPNLKSISFFKDITKSEKSLEIIGAILAISKLDEFQTHVDLKETDLLKLLATQTQLKIVELRTISDIEVLFASLPKSVQCLKFFVDTTNLTDLEQILILLLNSNFDDITVFEYYAKQKTEFEELLRKYLDDNQQSEGDRTRQFCQWKFSVSANNRILNLQQPEKTILHAEISDDKEDEISDFSNDQDHYDDSY